MHDVQAGAFQALVLFDLGRFGRQAQKTMALNALADVGVTVWDSSTGRARDLDTFEVRLPRVTGSEAAAAGRVVLGRTP